MTLIGLVLTLIVVGVLLWLLNTYGGAYIDGKILKIINVVVVIAVIFWLLTVFGLLPFANIPVPRAG
jgi:hypothetical protein